MNIYDLNLLPYLIGWACGINPVERQRNKLIPQARGRVLEIGVGTIRQHFFCKFCYFLTG